MKKTLFTLLFLTTLIGCNIEEISTLSQKGKYVFTVEAAPYENMSNEPETKSKYFDEDGQKVTNLNVWVYVSSTGALANTGTIPGTNLSYKSYFENQTTLDGDLLFPDFDETYDIYMFTNVGQITPPANKSAAEAYKYSFSSYDSFASDGFPMAAHYNFRPSDESVSHSLTVQRLVSRYTVTFNFSGDNNYKFNLLSAVVKQSANVITPFIEGSKASSYKEVFITGDELDVTKLTAPAGQDLYLLENVQGTVFTSGAVRSEKNIDLNAKPVASYLEFVGELDKNDGTGYHKVTCRYYFGSGTFVGVKRNLNIPLTLTMTNSILDHDDWIVTPEDPYNTGYVVFDPTTISILGDGKWNSFTAQTYSAEGINDNVKYKLAYNTSDFSNAGLTLQYRKSTSNSWANYSGQELTGKYYFQVKSTYSGSTETTVKFDAVDLQSSLLLGKLNIVVSVKNTEEPILPEDKPITPNDFYITIAEYVNNAQICIHVVLNESHDKDIIFTYKYTAFNGTPDHKAAENAGMSYVQLLNNYRVSSDDLTGSFTIPAGTTDYLFKTAKCSGLRHFKREVAIAVHGYPSDKNIIQSHITDYSYDSDNYLTAELSSGGGSSHTPICLGTIKYIFSDYDLEENSSITTNYNRIGYLYLLQGHFPPSLSESSITIDLVKSNNNEILETRTETISNLTTLIRFDNYNNKGRGFSGSELNSGTYFRIKSYSLKKSNGDYYILSLE